MKKTSGVTFTVPEANKSPLKIGRDPKGIDRIPTIHFQVQTVGFREGKNPKKASFTWIAKSAIQLLQHVRARQAIIGPILPPRKALVGFLGILDILTRIPL